MGRTKKTIAPEQPPMLSEQETWDVLRFASNMFEGALNPLLVSQRLKDITISPQIATSEKVEKALQSPKDSEDALIGYSEFFELTSMIYKRMLHYLSGLLSFDLTYTCINISDEKEYKSKQYKKDFKILTDFLDSFDVKKEFKLVMRQLMRNEAYFGILRDEGFKYSLQELPQKYTMITGRWDYGLLFDIDMYWFYQPGVDQNMYPPILSKMFERAFGNKQQPQYVPSLPIENRDSSWVKWVQASPKDGFWCFKLNPEIATRIPFLAPLFPDVVTQPIIRQLQTNSYIASASKLLIGKVPMLDKSVKGASVKDAVAITPEMLGKFLALLKAGLSETVKVGVAPLEDMQGVSFPLDAPFYQEYLKTTTSASGVNSRLIYTTDRNNAIESQLSVNVDEFLMTMVYPYFANFLEYFVNKRTSQYKWQFNFEGTEFFTNRKERLDTQLSLIPFGIVMPQKIASAIGMLPHVFQRHLAEGRSMDFVGKLTPIMTSFNAPANGTSPKQKEGRPGKPDGELSDGGEASRTNGGNIDKGGDE